MQFGEIQWFRRGTLFEAEGVVSVSRMSPVVGDRWRLWSFWRRRTTVTHSAGQTKLVMVSEGLLVELAYQVEQQRATRRGNGKRQFIGPTISA
jgi:hypothetical protein